MKRVLVMVLALMLFGIAIAEGMTPAMFIGSRGFVVMDENRLNSMNQSEDSQPIDGKKFNGLRICVYVAGGEQSTETIMFTDNDVYYVALDMMAMFSGENKPTTAMAQTFIDLCNSFDFDLYLYGFGEGPMSFYGEKESLITMMEAFDTPEEKKIEYLENAEGFCESKEEFINKVKQLIE